MDFRFARAPFLTLVTVVGGEPREATAVPNPAVNAPGGAGPMAAQKAAEMGANVVLAPRLGPNATAALQALGIQVFMVPPGITVKEAVEMYLRGQLQPMPAFGFGRGRGMGRGRGGGWGWGGGGGGRGWSEDYW